MKNGILESLAPKYKGCRKVKLSIYQLCAYEKNQQLKVTEIL